MRVIKGFMLIQSLINNAVNTISPIGELSIWSQTYSKDQGEYTVPSENNYRLISFKSITEGIGNTVIDTTTVAHIVSVIKEIHVYLGSRQRPYDVTDLRLYVQAKYPDELSLLIFGAMVDGGPLSLPEFVSWHYTGNGGTDIKIWLADESFQNQYDEFEIVVIPPIKPIDSLFGTYSNIQMTLSYRTPDKVMSDIQDAKEEHPETYLRTVTVDFVPTNNALARITTYWNLLIYGAAGDNVDSISEAIVNYILANTTHPRSEWETILPSLFRKLEFVIVPNWDDYAIPDKAIESGIYSSYTNPNNIITKLQALITFYTPAHVKSNITIMPYPYKGLALAVINGVSNVESNRTLDKIFPDYIPVLTSSLDFNRMSDNTQEWSKMLEAMLIAAETATNNSSLVSDMRKTIRDNKLYVSKVFNNINYLIYAKSN